MLHMPSNFYCYLTVLQGVLVQRSTAEPRMDLLARGDLRANPPY
jgi:hypothetical protein